MAQTRPVDEIIVVDNNSTDRTAAIAHERAQQTSSVRVITEPTPGVARARDAGFAAATGDIIGRVDADTRPRARWARIVTDFFAADVDGHWDAITGPAVLIDAPGQRKLEAKLDRLAETVGGREGVGVHGLSVAIRRRCWERIRGSLLSNRTDLHEDHDMGAAIRQSGGRIWLDYGLIVDHSARRYLVPPWRNIDYALGGLRTAWARRDWKVLGQQALFLPVGYFFLWVLWIRLRGWDPASESWSLSRCLDSHSADRVSPVG